MRTSQPTRNTTAASSAHLKQTATATAFLTALLGLGALGLAGCDEVTPPPDKKEDTSVAETVATDTVDGGDGATDAAATPEIDSGATDDAALDDTADTPAGCPKNCSEFKVKACEVAKCVANKCVAEFKPNTCCSDGDCAKVSCTNAKCDIAAAKCTYTPIVDCCGEGGTLQVFDVGFEQSSFEGFKETVDNALTDNVKWQLSTKRAHTGKTSLYLGNDCYTYDPSMSTANGCGPGPGLAVVSHLKSPDITIPPGKAGQAQPAMLHFWYWLATEPQLTGPGGAQVAGTCSKPCAADQSCVKIDAATSQCVFEKDVLVVKVNGDAKWYSTTETKKTTGGVWKHALVNLGDAGGGVSITWEFDTKTGAKNNFEGVYLDDIKVETICAKEGTLCNDTAPCKPDAKDCTVDACTKFSNLPGQGFCFFDQTPGCCQGTGDCDDKNTCTIDSCSGASAGVLGQCKSVPDASNNQCCQPAKIAEDNFESGSLSGWKNVESPQPSVVKWQIDAKGGVGGGSAAWFGNATTKTYDDPGIKPKGPKGEMCKAVKLMGGTVYNIASFQVKLTTEWSGKAAAAYKNPPGSHNPCAVTADCAIKGEECYVGKCGFLPKLDELTFGTMVAGQWKPLWSSDALLGSTQVEDGDKVEAKFQPVSVALDSLQGQEVSLCFRFDAGDATANSFAGPFIDEFKVDVACTYTECVADTDAACVLKCSKACEKPSCAAGACLCVKTSDKCCTSDAMCNDSDTCTVDACKATQCTNEVKDAACCSNKTSVSQDFEKGAAATANWTIKTLSGNSQSGKPYDTAMKWAASALKAASGSTYSLYFGKDGTYNTGATVPAAQADSPDVLLPKNGFTLVTFDLFLSTEWNGTVFVQPGTLVIDRLRVGLFDPAETDAKKAIVWTWSSYAIGGTTNGKWQSVVTAVPDAWKGKTARLRFEFDAGHEKNNNFEGAYIDNLQVQTLCDKPECTEEIDCPNADPCKKSFCSKDAVTAKFACKTDFKPGPGCCAPNNAVALETFEGGTLGAWSTSCTPGINVKWQAVPHKYLTGAYEAYMGNPAKGNYDEGATVPVKCELVYSKAFQLKLDADKGAKLVFKMRADVEKSFETLQVFVKVAGSPTKEYVWSKAVAKDFSPDTELKQVVEKKVDLAKFKGKGNLTIGFEFDSGDGGKNDKFEGIHLDDLQVVETCL